MEKTSIRNTMMLANLSIGTWTGRKIAKEQARKVEIDAKARAGTVSAVKRLFAGVKELEDINKKATFVRVEFGKRTVPWFDNGPRAFNASGYFDMMEWVKEQRAEFKGIVSRFLPLYPSLRANRQFELGDLFNDKDFPNPDEMQYKFYFKFDVSTVPNADDIRIVEGFSDEDAAALTEYVEKKTQKKVQDALGHAAQRLYEVVQHMHKKLNVKAGDTGGEFRNTLTENIADLVALMPTLNVTNDPTLKKLTDEAYKMSMYSPDELRGDDTKRVKAAAEAKSLAKKLSDLFTGE